MKEKNTPHKPRPLLFAGGLLVGVLNGLLGAGGGMLAVPLLRKSGLNTKQCHGSSIAVILPVSLFSAVLYLTGGRVQMTDVLPYLPAGLAGAALGGLLLNRLPQTAVRMLFAGFMIWSGIRLLMR